MMLGHGTNPVKKFKKKKKIKIGHPEYSLNPHSPKFDNISFLPYPPPLFKVDVICVSSPMKISRSNDSD